ncbi:MAG: hypothetical protein JWN25_217 [Verrucomicrobiales bacterium]|nr:hypothetical protein [Verrucomicrobiales bacterium]
MWLFDFILDWVALLLWLRATSFKTSPVERPRTISPLASIKPADHLTPCLWAGAAMLAVIVGRAVIYWKIGTAVDWMPTINFPSIAIPLRSNSFGRMLTLSCLTFGVTLYLFYTYLLLLISLTPGLETSSRIITFLRKKSGVMRYFPKTALCVFPFACGFLFWTFSRWIWVGFGLLPESSWGSILKEACVLGLNAFLPLQYLLYGLLGFAFMNSTIFFGTSQIVQILSAASKALLAPFRRIPLTLGKWDLVPILLIILIGLGQYFARIGLWQMFRGFLIAH